MARFLKHVIRFVLFQIAEHKIDVATTKNLYCTKCIGCTTRKTYSILRNHDLQWMSEKAHPMNFV